MAANVIYVQSSLSVDMSISLEQVTPVSICVFEVSNVHLCVHKGYPKPCSGMAIIDHVAAPGLRPGHVYNLRVHCVAGKP